jgi:AraC family transcriptional regulator of adaptative response / DNA-3-methyladenine glycosylase II
VIGPLIAARPGIRVPGAWGPFEIAVQAVVRDQLPPEDAYDVLHKLVEVHGMPVPGLGHELTHAFPGPQALTEADLVGPLAQEVAAGNVELDSGEDAEVLVASLQAVPGVSTKAAHQVALRLGARDAWPFDGEAESLRPWRSLAAVHRMVSAS